MTANLSKIMKRAWKIRKAVAEELAIKVSSVDMGGCLKMAWEEEKKSVSRTLLDIAVQRLKAFGFTDIKVENTTMQEYDKTKAIRISFKEELNGILYRDYKTNPDYVEFYAVTGTYDSKTKTIDLISKEKSIVYVEEYLMQSAEGMTEKELKHAMRCLDCQGYREQLDNVSLEGRNAIEKPNILIKKRMLGEQEKEELTSKLF